MRKKVLSVFLALVMVLCIAPMAAFAEGTLTEPTESSGELSLPEESVEEKTGAAAVQALIDALPDAESIDESNMEDVTAQLEAIDDVKLLLSDEEENSIDYTRYGAAAAVLQALMSGTGTGSESAPMIVNNVAPTEVSTEAALQAAVSTGGSYILTANITLTANLEVSSASEVSLDLNGQSVNGNFNIVINTINSLVISNSDIVNGIIGSSIVNFGSLTITGGTVSTVQNSSTCRITGGTVSSGVINEDFSFMTMSSGMINGSVINDEVFNMYGGTIAGSVTNNDFFYITGGTITGKVTNDGDISMSAGMITDSVTNSGHFIMTGGTIDFKEVKDHHLENTGTFYAGGGTVTRKNYADDSDINEGTIQAYGNDSTKFNNELENRGTISGGDFSGTVTNDSKGTISGGNFKNKVINNGTITGGTYTGTVANSGLIYATANVTGAGSITYDKTAGSVITYKIGENKYAEQFVKNDSTATKPAIDPKQTGYTFGGWYTDPECTKAFDFENTTVATAITLYGKMIECDHTGNTNALSCTEDTICSVCSGTIKAAHLLYWKADATHYWQECIREGCDYTTVNNKKETPTIEIKGKDKVHTDQDYTFSFTLSDGLTFLEAGYEFTGKGGQLTDIGTSSPYTVTLEADWYDLNDTQFKINVSATTTDGYTVTATETVDLLVEHELTHTSAKAATTTEAGNKEYWYCDVCEKYFSDADAANVIPDGKDGVVIPKLPVIIKGDGQTVTGGEKKALAFTSDADYAAFVRVLVDGKELPDANYTVQSGSTVVTLKAEYVATLSAGEHTLGIVSENGTATAKFTVNKKAAETTTPTTTDSTKSPQTGDSSNIIFWISLLCISVIAVVVTTIVRWMKQYCR